MNIKDYIKPSYTFKEVYELQKLPLSVKIEISVEVLRRAFELSQHNIALAFSGGKRGIFPITSRVCSAFSAIRALSSLKA